MRAVLWVWVGCALAAPPAVHPAVEVSMDRELHLLLMGQTPPRHIPGAEFRVAVFTYDDPHDTKLGNALAALVGRHVLLRSGVRSIGVIGYTGSYKRSAELPWSYFDRVEKLTEAQQASLAIWGMIQRLGEDLVIDTYVQIPKHAREQYFTWRLRLPESMGGGDLVARLRPDRVHVQRLRLPASAGGEFAEAAASIARLRGEPRPEAPVIGKITLDEVYYVKERHEDDWVYLVSSDFEGWAPLESHCEGHCRALLEAGGFAGGVLAHMARPDFVPQARPRQTAEALAVEEQLQALEGLNAGQPQEIYEQTVATVEKWIGPSRLEGLDDERGIDRGSGLPPGGAAFANLRALGHIALALQEDFRRLGDVPEEETKAAFDSVEVDIDVVSDIAFDLAEASLDDPRNTDVLHNLAVLFDYVGDSGRAGLARSLEEKLDASSESGR